ncbi:MAG: preprotein translocase subunit SecG [Paracoccaceae bacterium]
MQNVVLVIHLILAVSLIGVVLLQRSEGGGMGLGGGGGGGAISSRGVATALGKLTWALAIAFIITSITLTILAAKNSATGSVVDRLGIEQPVQTQPGADQPTDGAPTTDGDPQAPVQPRAE